MLISFKINLLKKMARKKIYEEEGGDNEPVEGGEESDPEGTDIEEDAFE